MKKEWKKPVLEIINISDYTMGLSGTGIDGCVGCTNPPPGGS